MSYTEDDLRQALLLLEHRVPGASTAPWNDEADEFLLTRLDLPELVDAHRHRAPLLLGAVAVAAAVAAATTVVTTQTGAHRPASDRHVTSAPLSPDSNAATTPHSSVALPAPLRIDPTWLPASARQLSAMRGNNAQYRQYDMGADMHLEGYGLYGGIVLVDQPSLPAHGKFGIPVDVTLAGHPAREWAIDGSYDLYVQIAPRQTLNIQLRNAFSFRPDGKYPDNPPTTSAANLRTMGRRIAAAVRFDARDTLSPDYSLTYLPAGSAVAFLGRDSEQSSDTARGTSYYVVPAEQVSTSDKTEPWTITEVLGSYTPDPEQPDPTAGRPVQGHRSLVGRVADGTSVTGYVLTVLDVRPGVNLQLRTGSGVTSLNELYRVADGVRWN